MTEDRILSKRGCKTVSFEDFLTVWLNAATQNPFHPVNNPNVSRCYKFFY